MTAMKWHRPAPYRWAPRTKYEPTPDEVRRAAAKRAEATRAANMPPKSGDKVATGSAGDVAHNVPKSGTNSSTGIPCPQCNQPTEVRTHPVITAKMQRTGRYYTKWHFCRNPMCRERAIYDDRDRVDVQRRLAAITEQLRTRR